MNSETEADGIPTKDQEFKASEDGAAEHGTSEEQHAMFAAMSPEQWNAHIAEANARGDELLQQQEAANKEKWQRKVQALNAAQPTGNLIEDFKAFVSAAQEGTFNPNSLRIDLQAALETGDEKTMETFFQEMQRTSEPQTQNQEIQGYVVALRDAAQRILQAYYEKQRETKNSPR